MHVRFLFLSLLIPSMVSAETLNPKLLVSPLEVWQVNVPDERIGSIKTTFSFTGIHFYQDDITNKRYANIFEDKDTLLTGFMTTSIVDNKNVAKNCHFPRVQIMHIEGLKKNDGTILVWNIEKIGFFSGVLEHFRAARTYVITCDKKHNCNLVIDYMGISLPPAPLKAERLGPLPIVKIQ